MNICFFSTQHFGDIYFSQPYIFQICENNPEITFYYWCFLGHSVLQNKKNNLKYIEDNLNIEYNGELINGSPPEDRLLCDQALKHLFILNTSNTNFIFEYNNKKYIAINTHCSVLHSSDICSTGLTNGFNNVINIVNKTHNLNIIFTPPKNIMPSINNEDIHIDKFMKWHTNMKDKRYVFIFNFKPRSLQINYNYNDIVKNLALIFPNITFIVSCFDSTLSYLKNVKFCDKDFDCKYNVTCTNLLMIEQIQRFCKLIFVIPSGSAWVFFNDDIDNYIDNKIFMINHEGYTNRLNTWYKEYKKDNINILNNICVGQIRDTIESLLTND